MAWADESKPTRRKKGRLTQANINTTGRGFRQHLAWCCQVSARQSLVSAPDPPKSAHSGDPTIVLTPWRRLLAEGAKGRDQIRHHHMESQRPKEGYLKYVPFQRSLRVVCYLVLRTRPRDLMVATPSYQISPLPSFVPPRLKRPVPAHVIRPKVVPRRPSLDEALAVAAALDVLTSI